MEWALPILVRPERGPAIVDRGKSLAVWLCPSRWKGFDTPTLHVDEHRVVEGAIDDPTIRISGEERREESRRVAP